MTEESGPKDAPHPLTDEARALGIDVDDPGVRVWMQEHLAEYRQQASGQRPQYWILGIGFVVGLAAHVGGYLLRSSATTEPFGLVADLLYSLGFALWTGVVLVFFVQIWPEAKRRQLKRSLDAYDAALREKTQAGSDQASGDDGAPTARWRRLHNGWSVRAKISTQAKLQVRGQDVGAAPRDHQAPAGQQPRQGPLHHPAVATQPGGGLHPRRAT